MAAAYPHPDHLELRAKLVTGFTKYVVFYSVRDDGVYIVRVLHGARDIPRVLDQ
jgi:plasmid stabilization system protein ParE